MKLSPFFGSALALVVLAASPTIAAPKPPPSPAAPAAPTDADWRTPDPQDILVIDTNKGRVIVEMNEAAAPAHVDQIRALARSGVYDGRSFFRVIDNFMDQTGDPLDSGLGASSLPNLKAEFTFKRGPDTPFVLAAKSDGIEEGFLGSLPVLSQPMDLGLLTADHKVQAWGTYCPGVAGMARSDDLDSANSQFFLMRTNTTSPDHGSHSLDKQYTAWGRAIAGQDVIDSIKTGEPAPAPQDKMLTVKVLADMPEATRPKVRVIDVKGAWFKAELDRERAAAGSDFSVCMAKMPVDVKDPLAAPAGSAKVVTP
jgi:peptidylprolyl isomerase